MQTKRTVKLSTYSLFSALVFATSLVSPAQALDPTILPIGANGTNGNPELFSAVCPSGIQLQVPFPVKENGYGSHEALQGYFSWHLSAVDDESGQDIAYASGSSGFATATRLMGPGPEFDEAPENDDEPWLPGQEITFNLEGVADGYAPTSFNFTATVMDPSFDQGSGTLADPYIINTADDLTKMRCHHGKSFKLGKDITLTETWIPISKANGYSYQWFGTLDGDGHKISGLDAGNTYTSYAGLFAGIDYGFVKDLTFVSPKVIGTSTIGTLAGSIKYGVKIRNVSVVDAEIKGQYTVGLMVGNMDYGCAISNSDVEGKIESIRGAAFDANYWMGPGVTLELVGEIGGMVGFENGDGTSHWNNSVDVEIIIKDEVNYRSMAETNGHAIMSTSGVLQVGGYLGESDEDSYFGYLDVKSKISMLVSGDVYQVGGLAGQMEDDFSHVNLKSNLSIVSLGAYKDTHVFIRQIGGAIGQSDDQTINFSNIDSSILIEPANASNNPSGLIEYDSNTFADNIGGVGGDWDDDTADFYNRAKINIDIKNVETITDVGGYVGNFDDDNSMGYSDLFVSGKIKLNASNQIDNVAGFAVLSSQGSVVGDKLFAAVSMETSGTASVTDFRPFVVSPEDYRNRQNSTNAFWDVTLNNVVNPADHLGLPATTSQLKSANFLSSTGMDLTNVWKLSPGSYPELLESVYTWGFTGSGSSVIVAPSPVYGPLNIVMPSTVQASKNILVTGSKLNTVARVLLNNQPADYIVKADGTLLIPTVDLNAGEYKVEISGVSAGTTWSQNISVIPTVQVKVVKGKVLMKLAGLSSKQVSWKVGKQSGKVFVLSNKQTLTIPVLAQQNTRVKVTVDGKVLVSKSITTK